MTSEGLNQEKIWDHFQNEGIDSFSHSRGRLEFLVRRLPPGKRVLNIGVGNGLFESLALSRGLEVWSLDPSERAIERLRQALALESRAQVGYSQKMPFQDAHFDAVVMSEVLEHLDDEVLAKTLQEVRRVLKLGGMLLGTVPSREILAQSFVVCPHCSEGFHRWGHQRSFDVPSLSRILGAVFLVRTAKDYFFIDWDSVGAWRKLQGLVKKFLSWRGIGTYGASRNIYFAAEKTATTGQEHR
nr:putative class I SAM-dependent methyltransferase [uncultured bacterium]